MITFEERGVKNMLSNKPVVETTVPISLENLKKNFEGDGVTYLIDYKNSKLDPFVLITYLSNLEIDFRLKIESIDETLELLVAYLNSPTLIYIPDLVDSVLEVLLSYKGIENNLTIDLTDFFEENKEILDVWVRRLDAMLLFALYSINDDKIKDEITKFPVNTDDSMVGCNFVHLFRTEGFEALYMKVDERNLEFYPNLFDKYVFKGNNLFYHWSHENNVINLLVTTIALGEFDVDQFIKTFMEVDEEK